MAGALLWPCSGPAWEHDPLLNLLTEQFCLTVKEKNEEGESEEAVEKNLKEKVKLKKKVNLKLYHQNSIANSMNCQTICVNSKGLMNS